MKRPALLDVNVLVAVLDAAHVHHDRAVDWFVEHAHRGWATCPLVDLGFTRVMCSAGIPGALRPDEAVELLRQLKASPGYRFVADSLPLEEVLKLPIKGIQQLTDVYLVALCRSNDIRLATFDRRIEAPDVVVDI